MKPPVGGGPFVRLPGVYAPQEDSWTLARHLVEEIRERLGRGDEAPSVLDLCTGTGALAVTASMTGAHPVESVDVNPRAIWASRLNAWRTGTSVRVHRADVDDLAQVFDGTSFDIVVSNTPYVPSLADGPGRGAARAWDAGRDGRLVLDRICRNAPALLRAGGVLFIVHSQVSDPLRTVAMLREGGLDAEVVEHVEVPFGPVMRARAAHLRAVRMLPPGARSETLAVVRACHAG